MHCGLFTAWGWREFTWCGGSKVWGTSDLVRQCRTSCLENCEVNELPNVLVVGITWGEVSPDLLLLPPLDIILGSDVFYEPQGEFRLTN